MQRCVSFFSRRAEKQLKLCAFVEMLKEPVEPWERLAEVIILPTHSSVDTVESWSSRVTRRVVASRCSERRSRCPGHAFGEVS